MGDTLSAGCLDGKAMVEMNNLAVGYFPTQASEVSVYPPPVPAQPPGLEDQNPVTVEQGSGKNS